MKRDGATVIDPSPIVMILDGYDLSSGVVFGGAERYEVNGKLPVAWDEEPGHESIQRRPDLADP